MKPKYLSRLKPVTRCRRAIRIAMPVMFALAAIGAGTTASAALLNPRGIPQDTVFLAHLDLDAARDSKATAAALSLCEASVPEIATFKQMTGVDLLADVSGITLGVLHVAPKEPKKTAATNAVPPAAERPSAPAPPPVTAAATETTPLPPPAPLSAAAILRGRFSPSKIFAITREAKCPTRLIHGYTFIELSDKERPNWKLHLAPLGPRALALLTDIAQAPSVITAYRDASYSRRLPPALAEFTASATPTGGSAPAITAFAEIKEPTPDGRVPEVLGGKFPLPEEFFLLFADDGQQLSLHATGTYSGEAAANRSRVAILGATALLRMVRPDSTPAGPNAKPAPAFDFSRLLDALKFEASGRLLRLELNHPTREITEALQKADARKRANLPQKPSTP